MRHLLLLLSFFVIFSSCSDSSTEPSPVYNLTTSAEPSEAGSVNPSSAEAEEGGSIQVTASANEHWVFESWVVIIQVHPILQVLR
ncbi:MAG: hypothetical protein U5K71_17030 [Gracilimonas sp.]|nr:hypothetical protein [Gracilimonas sp.]